jgi:hypothetical protein
VKATTNSLSYDLIKETAVRRFIAHNPNSTMQRRFTYFLCAFLPHSHGLQRGLELTLQQRPIHVRGLRISHDVRWSKVARLPSDLAPALHAQFAPDMIELQFVRHLLGELEGRGRPCPRPWVWAVHVPSLDVMTLMTLHVSRLQRERTAMTCAQEGRWYILYVDHCLIDLVESFLLSLMLRTLRQSKRILQRTAPSRVSAAIAQRPNVPYGVLVQDIVHASASRHVGNVDTVPSSEPPREAGLFAAGLLSSYPSRCARAPASARWMKRWSLASTRRRYGVESSFRPRQQAR